jgi:DNA-directed RNA polymerase specialized sigma24 family protein
VTSPRQLDGPKRAMRSLSDGGVVEAMRDGVPAGWAEFDERFRPLLTTYARRLGIPHWHWDTCVMGVLDDEALRLARRDTVVPSNISSYLFRAVYHRYLKVKREAARRAIHYKAALGESSGNDGVVGTLCSEDALRNSENPLATSTDVPRTALHRFAQHLGASLTAEERHLLGWAGDCVPRRQMAEWMGLSYEATRKRLARLCERLRRSTPSALERLTDEERVEVEGFLRRFGRPQRSGNNDR